MLHRRSLLFSLAAVSMRAFGQRDPWRPGDLLPIAQFAPEVQAGKAPPIFMVGPRVIYSGAHITGAEYAGPTNSQEGIDRLLKAAARVSKDSRLVIYCGCCPMDVCPNIRPAYSALQRAGYRNFQVLDVPTNLKTDWTAKGYPVDRSSKA